MPRLLERLRLTPVRSDSYPGEVAGSVEQADTVDAAAIERAPAQPATPGDDLGLAPDTISVERVRAAVHRRVFGEVVEPVRIGRYTVLKRLGAGGMGVVYAAYDTALDRKVALKLLNADTLDPAREASRRARLVREAKALARLSHPGIVQVFEVGTHEEQLFIAMEFVDGVTLGTWVRERSRGWRAITAMYVEAGRGLAAAHAAGLVHRDVKPDNMLVGHDGRVRVLDFGLAGDMASSSDGDVEDVSAPQPALGPAAPLTRTGMVLGTPAYMAPEQHLARRADAQSDQFGFCVALWEGLFGERPFVGESLAELSAAVIQSRLHEPSHGAQVPRALRRCLLRGLAREPARRHATMDALLGQLESILRANARRVAAAGAVVSGLLLLGGVGMFMQREQTHDARAEALSSEVVDQRSRADEAELSLRAREEAVIVAESRLLLPRDPTRALASLRRLPEAAAAWSAPSARMLAAEAIEAGVAERIAELPPTTSARVLSPGGRWAWHTQDEGGAYVLIELASGRRVVLDAGPPDVFPELTFSRDETQVVTAQAGAIRLWDLARGDARELGKLTGFAGARRFADDGSRVTVIEHGDTTVAIVTSLAGDVAPLRRTLSEVEWAPVINRDGTEVVGGNGIDRLWVHDLVHDRRRTLVGAVRSGPQLSPDGRWIAALAAEGLAVWHDGATTPTLLPIPAGLRGDTIAFDPAGTTVALASAAGPIVAWDLASRRSRTMNTGARAQRLWVMGNGRVVGLREDGSSTLFDRTGHDQRTLRSEPGITDLAIVPDLEGAPAIVTVGEGTEARWWRWPDGTVLERGAGPAGDVAIDADTTTLLSSGDDGAVRRTDTHGSVVIVPGSDGVAPSLALSRDAARLAVGSGDAITIRSPDGVEIARLGDLHGTDELRFLADDETVAWRGVDGVQRWRPGGDAVSLRAGSWHASAVSPDGRSVVVLGSELARFDEGAQAPSWRVDVEPAWRHVIVDRSGERVLAAGVSPTMTIFDAATGDSRTITTAVVGLEDVAFGADTDTLFAVGQQAYVIDARDGTTLAYAIPTGTTTLGDRSVAVGADGRHFAYAGADGLLWRRHFDAPVPAAALQAWVADAVARTDAPEGAR